MTHTTSPSVQRRYSLATVCRVWGVSWATLYRQRGATAANETRPPSRRGPRGAATDADLLDAIREVIEASPFTGEGYRKVWARLRLSGLRTAARRVRRIMKEHGLLAPHRPAPRAAHPHDGTIVTERVDQVWGTDMTETITTTEGRAFGISLGRIAFDASLFVAVDHCSGEFVGTHAASGASRWEALEPVRQGVEKHFDGLDAGAAAGLTLRHDHGSNYMSIDFQREIRFLGVTSSPAFVRQPEGNGVAERAIRTLKEQLLWVRHFATVEELRLALAEFAALYNATWLRERHGHKTPDQIRAAQLGLETEAATVKLAA
ncbi:IS3 family transposase [Amaricoccus solimangrovi]|uniref:DDE-type integrase/transposase/recombinase n=1 Tax=Amaricoccus solimangrovi TaxID=2589815 RepID=A0A501W2S6_9RHOB|nr:IS3 family transposase [Amaricoccus solimangrovi]TPE42935.1 DDE-type integrase/transposase/recombinase [Amaricoccus solimangrovi]